MKIFVNAGHGGQDPGAVSKNGLAERDACRRICSHLVKMLIQGDFDVEFFQQETSYNEIAKVENSSNSDIFVSVHCNSFSKPSANGAEVLYYPTSNKGKELAQSVQNGIVELFSLSDRGIKARSDLHVLKSTRAVAILVECAFISNPKEEILLRDNPELFAEAIFNGIMEYAAYC